MHEEEYIHLNTYYDMGAVRNIVMLLNKEKIDFRSVDRSNQTNYRIPMSTYTEVEILVKENNFEKVEQLLKDFK